MKKFYTFILFAMFAMFGLQSNAAVYVLGNTPFGNWNLSSALEMTQGEDGIYSLKMEGVGANCYFSIMLDNVSWDSQRGPTVKNSAPTGEWENANVAKSTWKTSMAGDYTILYNAQTEQAKITIDNGEEPDRDGYFLIGEFNDWQEDTQVPFVKDGDKYTLTYTFSGEFKIRDKSGDWFGGGHTFTAEAPSATLSGGDNFVIESEAEYTLTVENGVLTISGFGDAPVDEFEALILRGSPDETWSEVIDIPFERTDNGWSTFQYVISAGTEFKIVKKMTVSGDHWLGAESNGKFLINQDQLDNPIGLFEGGEYQNLYFDTNGVFEFTVNEDMTQLVVTGWFDDPYVPTYTTVYKLVMGEGGDWENAQTILDMEEGDAYWTLNNVDIVAGTEFKIVQAEVPDIEDTEEIWHWLGAVSDGNFWVTEEQLGNAIPLFEGAEYQNLYFENGGKYSFTFDADNETLTIAKAEVDNNGDLNGDGNVNTGDISALYAALLAGSNDPAFDLNGDGNVNTGDVSALYNIILGN